MLTQNSPAIETDNAATNPPKYASTSSERWSRVLRKVGIATAAFWAIARVAPRVPNPTSFYTNQA